MEQPDTEVREGTSAGAVGAEAAGEKVVRDFIRADLEGYLADKKGTRAGEVLGDFTQRRFTDAKRFEPAVVWRSVDRAKAGTPQEYQFPGRSDEPAPDGFVPVTLDSLRAIDRFTKSYNAVVKRQLDEEREMQRMVFDKSISDRRADALAKQWHNPKALALLKACIAYVDKKRARKYAMKIEPNFNMQAVSMDATNRQGWSSEESGWKDKKA